jgi:hypothetical protein
MEKPERFNNQFSYLYLIWKIMASESAVMLFTTSFQTHVWLWSESWFCT